MTLKLRMTLKLAVTASSIALLSSIVSAKQGEISQEKAEGWYWYDDTKAIKTTPQNTKALSPAWLRENLPKIQERAIANPTNLDGSPSKDVIAFMYVQKLILNEAQNYPTNNHQSEQLNALFSEIEDAFQQGNSSLQQSDLRIIDYLEKMYKEDGLYAASAGSKLQENSDSQTSDSELFNAQ